MMTEASQLRMRRAIALMIGFCLVFEQAGFAQVAPQFVMPAYLQNLAPVADQFHPVHLRSIALDRETDQYTVYLDKGDAGDLQSEDAQEAAKRLMSYVEIGLRLPNSMFWVNLRPDSPNDVIDPHLALTDVGKILLEADLQLKKDLARFTSPDTQEGKRYWDALYLKAENVFGGEDVEIPTLTRPWIVPGEIIVAAAPDRMYIYKATLNVMLEQDHLKDASFYNFSDPRIREMNAYSSELIRSMILPKLTREVNASKRYAGLRQVYYSLILAQQLKQKQGFVSGAGGAQIDTKDLTGLTSATAWSKESYYSAYKKSFSQGEYNKEESVTVGSNVAIRSFFSGGAALQELGNAVTVVQADGGNLETLALTNRKIYELSLDAPPNFLEAEQKERDNAIADICGLIAVKQISARRFEAGQRRNKIEPVIPFDLRDPDHALKLKRYITEEYSDADDQIVKMKGFSNHKKLKSRSEKIQDLTKVKALRAGHQLTKRVFDFVVPPAKEKDPRAPMKLNMAVLSVVNRHDYKDGQQPLTRAIFEKGLREKGWTRGANMRMYFRVLEYLGMVEIEKRGKEEIAVKAVKMPLLKTWFPDIDSYDLITFNETENAPEARDGGKGLSSTKSESSRAEALFLTFWEHFVETNKDRYFSKALETKQVSEVPYDIQYVKEFRDYMRRQILDEKGKFKPRWARDFAKHNKQHGNFDAAKILTIKHVLFPNEYNYIEKQALWVIYSHDYTKGPLTLADIDAKIKMPGANDTNGKPKRRAVKNVFDLEYLARMGVITVDVNSNRLYSIVGVHRNKGAQPGRFEMVYPEIKLYRTAAFKEHDSPTGVLKDMLLEAWEAEKAKLPSDKDPDLQTILDNINARSMNERENRTNGDSFVTKSVNNAKTGFRRWTNDMVRAELDARKKAGASPMQQAAAQDGGVDESLIETNNAQFRILQFFIVRAAQDNKIKIREFDPQHNEDHAQKLKEYLYKRFARGNPQQLRQRDMYLIDVKTERRKMDVSETQFCQVADFLLSQRSKKGVVVLDKPVLWAIFSHRYEKGALTLDKINKRMPKDINNPLSKDYELQEQKYQYYVRILMHVGIIVEIEKNGDAGKFKLKRINPELMELWFRDIWDYEDVDVRPAGAFKKKFAELLVAEMPKEPLNIILPEQTAALERAMERISHNDVTDDDGPASSRTLTDYRKEFRKAADEGRLRSLFEENGVVFKQGPDIVQARLPESRPVGAKDGGVKPGGVDLRALATAQSLTDASDTLSAGHDGLIPEESLRAEWRPYVSQCKTKDGAVRIDRVRAYLATILRAEEDYGVSTPPRIKEILAFIG
jgi:hypothetical protein